MWSCRLKARSLPFPDAQVQAEVFPYAAQLCDSIRANDSCTRPIFYMTWGRKNGDNFNCASWPPVCTYQGMDSILNQNYQIMAADNDALVAPAGAVWNYIRANHPQIELYAGDGSHPSLAGSYATACAFYSVIFRKNPELITDNYTLSSAEANDIRTAARIIAYDSLPQWNVGLFDPIADFSVSDSGATFTFTNLSEGANSYAWDFGDGSGSNLLHPSHTYTASASFVVKLIVSKCGISDTAQAVVNPVINTTAVGENWKALKVKLFFDPDTRFLKAEWSDNQRLVGVKILNPMGQMVSDLPLSPHQEWDLSFLPVGLYLIRLESEKGQALVHKLVIH
jgi:hypothetical protein